LQRPETGRKEISEEEGDALRRAGGEGAVAVTLAVAAIDEDEVVGREWKKGRTARKTPNPH